MTKQFDDADQPPMTKLFAVLTPMFMANAPVLWNDIDAGNEASPRTDMEPVSLALFISAVVPFLPTIVLICPEPERYVAVVAVVAVAALPVHEAEEPVVLSEVRAESTRTPYVAEPFHPINVGYEAVHAPAELVLLTAPPLGDVPWEASKITWLLP